MDPSSRPTRTVRSTSSAILGSATFRESWTRSVTSTCQSGPSMVMTWSVPSVEVVWNWVSTLTRARWYCSVQPRLTGRPSSSSSASLSLVLLGGRNRRREIRSEHVTLYGTEAPRGQSGDLFPESDLNHFLSCVYDLRPAGKKRFAG